MTEKEMQSVYPVNGHAVNGDTESAAHDADELRRKKKRKCIIFIVVFIVSNIVINSIMAVTILKARNPKYRIRGAAVTAFNGGAPARLSLEFSLKNTNFGRYKYPASTVAFTDAAGANVGTADVPNSKVGWRSTKKFKLDVELNLGNGNLTVIPVRATGKLRGKAEIMFMMKKRKGADLDCTIFIETATQQIGDITCN